MDDDVQVLKFATRMLASLGYGSVFQVASTEETHHLWPDHKSTIGLFISDFVMSQKTGDVMALQMATQKSALKILLMRQRSPHAELRHPAKSRLNFLQKPFTLAEMRRSIETLTQCG